MEISQAFSKEIEQFSKYKAWDAYASASLGPWIYGDKFVARLLSTTQKVRAMDWAKESFPMVGRSQHEALIIARETLKPGLQEAILVPWEPISRLPGDTTGGISTDLPEHFRTHPRNKFYHGTNGYGLPLIRREGLSCLEKGKRFRRGEQVRLFTAQSVWTCKGYAEACEFMFPCAEDLVFEDEEIHDVPKKFQFILCIPGARPPSLGQAPSVNSQGS